MGTSGAQRIQGGVIVLSVVNAIALVVTVLFRATAFFGRLVPLPADPASSSDRANTFGYTGMTSG